MRPAPFVASALRPEEVPHVFANEIPAGQTRAVPQYLVAVCKTNRDKVNIEGAWTRVVQDYQEK